ncbi:MAG TPA: hypothetical protein VFN97_08085 [Actinospica sp.]|nr:hypothetical protein [Actinospica sp.]
MAAAAALALGTCGSAFAAGRQSTPAATASAATASAAARLDAVKGLAAARIQGRIAALHALALAVGDSKYLTSSEKSTLGDQISSDLSGLTALATKAANETTVDAVRADETAMVDDYRVYLLMAPQVRLTEAFAAESAADATLQKAYDALKQLLARQSGGGTSEQQSELADLENQVTAAESAIGNEASVELAVRPGPNESAIDAALAPVRQAAKTARGDLVKASTDAKDLRASLK